MIGDPNSAVNRAALVAVDICVGRDYRGMTLGSKLLYSIDDLFDRGLGKIERFRWSADYTARQLKRAGFTDHQVHIIRDVATQYSKTICDHLERRDGSGRRAVKSRWEVFHPDDLNRDYDRYVTRLFRMKLPRSSAFISSLRETNQVVPTAATEI